MLEYILSLAALLFSLLVFIVLCKKVGDPVSRCFRNGWAGTLISAVVVGLSGGMLYFLTERFAPSLFSFLHQNTNSSQAGLIWGTFLFLVGISWVYSSGKDVIAVWRGSIQASGGLWRDIAIQLLLGIAAMLIGIMEYNNMF